jgi:hypothetical protein
MSYGKSVIVRIGDQRFQCQNVFGRGSYSEVWRADVLDAEITLTSGAPVREAALKEVTCTNQMELQQAIFEVQVLLALERAAASGGN